MYQSQRTGTGTRVIYDNTESPITRLGFDTRNWVYNPETGRREARIKLRGQNVLRFDDHSTAQTHLMAEANALQEKNYEMSARQLAEQQRTNDLLAGVEDTSEGFGLDDLLVVPWAAHAVQETLLPNYDELANARTQKWRHTPKERYGWASQIEYSSEQLVNAGADFVTGRWGSVYGDVANAFKNPTETPMEIYGRDGQYYTDDPNDPNDPDGGTGTEAYQDAWRWSKDPAYRRKWSRQGRYQDQRSRQRKIPKRPDDEDDPDYDDEEDDYGSSEYWDDEEDPYADWGVKKRPYKYIRKYSHLWNNRKRRKNYYWF